MNIKDWEKNVSNLQVDMLTWKDKQWIKYVVLGSMLGLCILFWKLDWMLWARIMGFLVFLQVLSNVKFFWNKLRKKF